MPKNWKTYNLGELVDLKQGLAINKKTKHLLTEDTSEIPLFKINDLINNTVKHYVKSDEVPKQCIAKEDELIYTRTGQVGLIFKGKEGCIHNNCFKIIPDETLISKEFIYWFLRQPHIVEYANNIASGSVQKDLNHTAFKSIEIDLPDTLKEQKAIANILSAIDDKIENNLAINKTLEDMVMALYKHWFVDFGPFEDIELIESEIFGNNETIKIPKSFKIISVKDSIIRLKQKNKYNQKNVLEKGIIRVFDQSTDRILGFHNNKPDFNADFENPILIFGDHTCRFEIVCEDFSVGPNLIPFKPNDATYNFIMYLGLKEKVKTNDYKRHWSELMLHQLIVPKDNKILNRFNNTIKENYRLINENEFENLYLSQLRDTLLPKLISGEVRLKEFQEQIETVL